MANDNPIPSFLMPAIIKAYKDRKKLEAQKSQELPNATALTGSPDKHPNEITAEEIIVRDQHNVNTYPALFNVNANANGDEINNNQGSPFQFSWWTIVGIIAAVLLLFYIVYKIRKCCRRCKAKKAAKEAKREAAEQARDSRLEAIAMSPIISEDLTGKFEKFNNDRFTEITEKIDKMMVETEPAATPKFITSPNTTLAEQIAAMPPVQFSNQAQPYPLRHSLAFGNNIAQMPALTYIEDRPRRNQGRLH